jgi:hypothetical protein
MARYKMNLQSIALPSVVKSFLHNKSGNIAIIAAILLPVLVGFIGLGTEVGYWHLTQRKLQQSADISAYSAGVRMRSGDSKSDYDAIAQEIAIKSGYDSSRGTITVSSPPVSGAYTGDSNALEVVLTEFLPPLFTAVIRNEPTSINARSVVLVQNGSKACVLALDTSASKALEVSGTANVGFKNCDLAANSLADDAFDLSGSASLKTECIYTVGGADYTSNLTLTSSDCKVPKENSLYVADPYRDVAEPSIEGPCDNRKNVGKPSGLTTVNPIYNHSSGLKSHHYCSGLQLKGKVKFNPGLYIIEGGTFSASAGAQIEGTGVTFYLTDGASMNLNGGATLNLAAPIIDPFSGILFFGTRSDSSISHSVNGGSSSTFQGLVYFAAGHVSYNGGAGMSNGCTQVIANTIQLTGNATIGSDCSGKGTKNIQVGQLVKHVE